MRGDANALLAALRPEQRGVIASTFLPAGERLAAAFRARHTPPQDLRETMDAYKTAFSKTVAKFGGGSNPEYYFDISRALLDAPTRPYFVKGLELAQEVYEATRGWGEEEQDAADLFAIMHYHTLHTLIKPLLSLSQRSRQRRW